MKKIAIHIMGDVGVGKTRLANHLASYLSAIGWDVSYYEMERGKGLKQQITPMGLGDPRRVSITVKPPR